MFPVKCNHDRKVLECVLESGRPFRYGLEVGSKAEMLMAMSMMGRSPGALLICNGYKDAAFLRLVGFGSSCVPLCSTPGARPPEHAVPRASHRQLAASAGQRLSTLICLPCCAGCALLGARHQSYCGSGAAPGEHEQRVQPALTVYPACLIHFSVAYAEYARCIAGHGHHASTIAEFASHFQQ